MTVREALAEATLYIPRRDAELLLAHVAGRPRTWVLSYPEATFSPDLSADLTDLVRRRDAGEPLQYLLGRQEFFGLNLRVTPDVLIPRPETEHLVEAVLAHFASETAEKADAAAPLGTPLGTPPRPLRIADVGTGSGAIALALAARLPQARIVALDISLAALAVAQANADQLGLSAQVRFFHSDLLGALEPELTRGELSKASNHFDAIVSNPPYVPLGDATGMQREVVEHEPHVALFAGDDGLDVYRRLLPAAHAALRPGGLLALEIGFGQRDALAALLAQGPGTGWSDVRFLPDYAGIDRIALAEKA